MHYILDRATGEPISPVEYRPVPQEPLQKTSPVQPYSGEPTVPLCATPDGDAQAVPNYKAGCLFAPHTDFPVIKSPGTGGGNDWAGLSYSPRTRLFYSGYGVINTAQSIPTGGVGFRPLGQRKGGGLVAKDPVTNKIVWQKEMGWSITHGAHILTTASDLLFVGQPDGYFLGLSAQNGNELFRFQTGAGVHTGAIAYMVDGEQYIAVLAGGNRLPYPDSPEGDFLWAFKLGGTVPEAPAPTPPSKRQPITAAAVEGSVVNNTVVLARTWSNGAVGNSESSSQNAMAPQHLRVPVGTTVRFLNHPENTMTHCATQFFEGLFNTSLGPGQSFEYTFTEAGEYFYNNCTFPQSTGKIVVYTPGQ
jgi:glucose dehydrogenase/plastocyanin